MQEKIYEEIEWFAMRVTYRRELEVKRLLDEKGVENFIPMKYEKSARTGRKRLVPVIHNLIFVRATASQIQELKKPTCIPLLQYMMDQRLGKKITVPEKQMRQFIAVTGTYDETLRFFGPSEINFSKAQKVRITGVSSEKSESQLNGLILALDVSVRPGTPQEIKSVIHTMRDRIQREIEHTTGMSLETIRVNVTTDVTR